MPSLSRSTLSGGIASINVGPDEVPFDAHIELLCSSSPFFDHALNGRFIEAETKIVPLSDDDPDAFVEFLSWLYRDKIFETNKSPGWLELSKLWILADMLGVSTLQNEVMAMFPAKFKAMGRKGNIHPKVLEYVYERSLPDSPIRCMLVDICAWGMEIEKYEKNKRDMPAEFLEDLCLVWMKKDKGFYKSKDGPFESHLPQYFVSTEPRTARRRSPGLPPTPNSTSKPTSEEKPENFLAKRSKPTKGVKNSSELQQPGVMKLGPSAEARSMALVPGTESLASFPASQKSFWSMESPNMPAWLANRNIKMRTSDSHGESESPSITISTDLRQPPEDSENSDALFGTLSDRVNKISLSDASSSLNRLNDEWVPLIQSNRPKYDPHFI